MTVNSLCDDLQSGFSTLFVCSTQGQYQRIRTPFLYPDGDYIDLFYRDEGDSGWITDLAETTGWLSTQTASRQRTQRQTHLIKDACMTHGVEFHRGMIQARCRRSDDLASAVTRVAQAALRVSDLWFTFRTQAVQTVKESIAEFLMERNFCFNRFKKLTGNSGQEWTIDFQIQTAQHGSLVQVLTTSNRSTANRACDHVVAGWHDLRDLKEGPERLDLVSLFDDTTDIWTDQDFKRVGSLSEVRRWSQPDEFVAALQPTA